jgi:anhydro-N-acetylmuramic acid kinase
MVYRAIGLMSGSSLDGLDIAFVEFHENAGKWNYELLQASCYPYNEEWSDRLRNPSALSAQNYMQLHADFGHFSGMQVNNFIREYGLQFKVALVSSHGHTSFHDPSRRMTAQLGDGAAIAAEVQLPVVSDLRNLDVAFGGQGAPIVPIGERLLWSDHKYFLNLGGIANVSVNRDDYTAFDICPANRVLNLLAADAGKTFDEGGNMAQSGSIDQVLLDELNAQDYYTKPFPKSLANEMGTDILYPLIRKHDLNNNDALHTYTEHIAVQVSNSLKQINAGPGNMLITGGGAFNDFLVKRIATHTAGLEITPVIPDRNLVEFKEAIVMALIGVLRWRQEYNVLSSVTGATRNSVGGALWTGEEA